MKRRDLLAAAVASTGSAGRAWGGPPPAFEDEAWLDAARQRELPVRLRWPAGDGPCGLVIHSHGLGGSRAGGAVWGEAWQAAGLAVLHLQHPGSDSSIWRSGLRGARQAAGAEQYLARIADAHYALDEVLRRQAAGGAWARVRGDAIGFSGHSFGARLTQAVAGERPSRAAARSAAVARIADARPRAFIAFSPGFAERDGLDDASVNACFGAIVRPFLAVTGTDDDAMIVGDASNAARRAVYRGLPSGQKAQLVLAGADHMTFGGGTGMDEARGGARGLRRGPQAAALQAQHQRVVAGVTSDWWRWQLLGDAAAKERLRAPVGLAAGDLWEQG